MKGERQKIILDIIGKKNIETQDEILEILRGMEYKVTQATVSRDIKDLQIVKVAMDNGSYRYEPAKPLAPSREEPRYTRILRETVIKVDYAGNTVVLKTHSGMANAAAVGIDAMDITFSGIVHEDIVGCIAGDDTIFILMRDAQLSNRFASVIRNIINYD